jgi:hypothetical protein
MEHKGKIYKIGTFRWGHTEVTALKVVDQIWHVISCSPISGQMSLKNITARMKDDVVKNWERTVGQPGPDFGLTSDGMTVHINKRISQEILVKAVSDCIPFLGHRLRGKPFVTVEARLPVISDGPHNVEVELKHNDQGKLTQFDMRELSGKKYYKVILDPIPLDWAGNIVTPMEKVLALIDDNVTVLADPFSTRNTSRRSNKGNEVKTIRPGLREKVRKTEVTRKKLADKVISVDVEAFK